MFASNNPVQCGVLEHKLEVNDTDEVQLNYSGGTASSRHSYFLCLRSHVIANFDKVELKLLMRP